MEHQRLYGLRGAIVTRNTTDDIELRVSQLWDQLLMDNGLSESDIVSCIFSVTSDLTAVNPAAALRRSGRGGGQLALFSVAEPVVDGGLQGVIRVLIHCYAPLETELIHVYLNGAEILRPDRKSSEKNV